MTLGQNYAEVSRSVDHVAHSDADIIIPAEESKNLLQDEGVEVFDRPDEMVQEMNDDDEEELNIEDEDDNFLSGCYVSQEQQADPEYQAVLAERWAAAVADMREYAQGYEWEFLKRDYAGIPLKHFVDNFFRYDPIDNDASEGGQHAPFFPSYIGELCSNRIEYFEPEQCP